MRCVLASMACSSFPSLGIVRLAVAAKSPTLHQVQQDSGKIHGGYRTVQSLCTQRVDIGQMPCQHGFLDSRPAG